MDGVIADFNGPAIAKAKELFNIELKPEDIDTPYMAQHVWNRLPRTVQDHFKVPWELYKMICSERFFLELPPLPGAIDAVKKIADADIEIVFCTKVMYWKTSWEKAEWLKGYFGDIKYITIMVDTHKAKSLVNGDIIIDDDPRVLDEILGPVPILIKQPWNKDHQHKYTHVAEDIQQAAQIAIDHKPYMDWWETDSPFGAPGC